MNRSASSARRRRRSRWRRSRAPTPRPGRAGVGIHHERAHALGLVGHPRRVELLLERSCRLASIVSWMLAAGLPAAGCASGSPSSRGGVRGRAGEKGLVALLDAVAALAVVSHEAEQLAGQRRAGCAARDWGRSAPRSGSRPTPTRSPDGQLAPDLGVLAVGQLARHGHVRLGVLKRLKQARRDRRRSGRPDAASWPATAVALVVRHQVRIGDQPVAVGGRREQRAVAVA